MINPCLFFNRKYSSFFWLLILFIYFFFSPKNSCYAQNSANYIPFLLTDSAKIEKIALSSSNSVRESYILPKEFKSDYKRSFNAHKNRAVEETTYLVKTTSLLDTIINPYLQNIFEKIIKANPAFIGNRLIISKSSSRNAFAMGDGTIFFNTGLLSSLENDAQIAFIICHELSHGYLNHVQLGLNAYLSKFYSDGVRKEYREIRNTKYNMGKLLSSLTLRISISNLYHQRNLESQADSLAFFLMRNTGYDVSQAYFALEEIDKPEDSSYLSPIKSSLFSCAEYTLPKLTDSSQSSSIFTVKAEVNNNDSLKTHPDSKIRMSALKKLMAKTGIDTFMIKKNTATYGFRKVVQVSKYETIQRLYDEECYDKSLYYSLLEMSSDLENNYLKAIGILSLYQLKYHLLNHRYSDVVSNTNEYNSKGVNDFLIFLNKLSLSDFKEIKNCINNNYSTIPINNEIALATSMTSDFISEDKAGAKAKAQEYLTKYPSGNFKKIANNLNK